MVFYQTRAPRRFLATLTKFDLELTPSRLKNPNFDSAIRMSWTGWNQCHCEYYQIFNPTTIHGSKSELERLRYHENRDNTPFDAPLTSRSHNFWLHRWIFEFHTFLETKVKIFPGVSRSTQSMAFWRWQPLKGRHLKKHVGAIKGPRHPLDQKKILPRSCSLPRWFLSFSPLFQTQKTHQSLLILLFTKNIR